jgi:hypothetical protein
VKRGLKRALERLDQRSDIANELVNKLMMERELKTSFDGFSGIWVPPSESVRIERWTEFGECELRVKEACQALGIPSLLKDRTQGKSAVKGVWYEVGDLRSALEQDSGLDLDPLLPIDDSPDIVESLCAKGWRYKFVQGGESAGLVRQFLALADLKVDDANANESVMNFTRKWGPLWLCPMHQDCFWSPPSISKPHAFNLQHYCRWFPSEPVIIFIAKAKQAETAIKIAGRLADKEPVPIEDWRTLCAGSTLPGFGRSPDGTTGTLVGKTETDLQYQQSYFAWQINKFLSVTNGPGFRFLWSAKKRHPVMVQDTGLGFFRLIWFQIAQILSGANGLYKCHECQGHYIPTRKPRERDKHYCLDCGKPAAKKQWARTRTQSQIRTKS